MDSIERSSNGRHWPVCPPQNFTGVLELANHTHRGRERVVARQPPVCWNTHGSTRPMSNVEPSQPSERGGLRPCRDRSSPIRTFFAQEFNHIDLFLELDAPLRPRGFRIDCLPHFQATRLVAHRNETSDGCVAVTDRYSTSSAQTCKVPTQLRSYLRHFHRLIHSRYWTARKRHKGVTRPSI